MSDCLAQPGIVCFWHVNESFIGQSGKAVLLLDSLSTAGTSPSRFLTVKDCT